MHLPCQSPNAPPESSTTAPPESSPTCTFHVLPPIRLQLHLQKQSPQIVTQCQYLPCNHPMYSKYSFNACIHPMSCHPMYSSHACIPNTHSFIPCTHLMSSHVFLYSLLMHSFQCSSHAVTTMLLPC